MGGSGRVEPLCFLPVPELTGGIQVEPICDTSFPLSTFIVTPTRIRTSDDYSSGGGEV